MLKQGRELQVKMAEISRRGFLTSCLGIVGASLIPNGLEKALGGEDCDIVLDPGHGMSNRKKEVYDPGCVYDGTQEAEYVLSLSKEIGQRLKQKGLKVEYTRRDAKTPTPLNSRQKIANKKKAKLFVSLHCNAFNSKARGVRTYHFPKSKKGQVASRAIQDNLVQELSTKGYEQKYDGVKTKRFYVLRKTKMPSVLVECGFLDNEYDRNFMANHQYSYVNGIVKGILSYLKKTNTEPKTPQPSS